LQNAQYRRIIYALFSQPAVGYWGSISGTRFRPKTPNLPTAGENPAGAHDQWY